MRKDNMLGNSIKNKNKLIPDGYDKRISDLLDSLPDEVPVSSDAEAYVIKHTVRFDIKPFVSAVAAIAVMSAAVISFSKMNNHAFDRNNDSDGVSYVTTVVTTVTDAVTTSETKLTEQSVTVAEENEAAVSITDITGHQFTEILKDQTADNQEAVREEPVNPVTLPVPLHEDEKVLPSVSDNEEKPVPEKPEDLIPPVPPVTAPGVPFPPVPDEKDKHPVPPVSLPHDKENNGKNDDKNHIEHKNEHVVPPHENQKNDEPVLPSHDEDIFGVYGSHR